MSILYEYLKVLENKKGKDIIHFKAPVRQRKNPAAPPYLVVICVILGCALALFFYKNTMIVSAPKETKGITNYQQNSKFTPIKSDITGFANNDNNAPGIDYSLKGIIYNAESPSAIIDGKLVEKNEKIGDWQVMEISPSEVRLENPKNNSLLTLKLNSSSEQ
jgi:hypothetical protein